jgi:Zn finger protein HypA/HybF involved in hydrogenase expression
MPEFSIKLEEIETILQLSIQQGGSKHRQRDIYEALDRVIARGPVPEKVEMPNISAKYITCPHCNQGNWFEYGHMYRNCEKCGEPYFRRL